MTQIMSYELNGGNGHLTLPKPKLINLYDFATFIFLFLTLNNIAYHSNFQYKWTGIKNSTPCVVPILPMLTSKN